MSISISCFLFLIFFTCYKNGLVPISFLFPEKEIKKRNRNKMCLITIYCFLFYIFHFSSTTRNEDFHSRLLIENICVEGEIRVGDV